MTKKASPIYDSELARATADVAWAIGFCGGVMLAGMILWAVVVIAMFVMARAA